MWFFNLVRHDYKYLFYTLNMKNQALKNITIVIPTYNSEKTINSTLESIYKNFENIIIIDAGPNNIKSKISKKYKIKFFRSSKGRGTQLLLGANKVSTNWIFFLHSDTILNKKNIINIKEFVSNDLNYFKAAAFKIKFNKNNILSNVLMVIANFRSKYFKLPYGDQGLLISRKFYKKIGGYKNIPIMEDIDIIHKIGFENIQILNSHIITSSIRYETQGWLIRPIINLYCLILYFCNYDINKINKIYLRNKNGKS